MAQTRTISHSQLTDLDRATIATSQRISDLLARSISDSAQSREFMRTHGKINYSRDAGMGLSAGKLQRDALTTRGRTDKSPFSNRNLRWHPLVLADATPPYAQEVDAIEIDPDIRKLIFVIEETRCSPETLHALEQTFCAPFAKWGDLVDTLSKWDAADWSENRCTIPAFEYSTPSWSVGTYACLGLAVPSLFMARRIRSMAMSFLFYETKISLTA